MLYFGDLDFHHSIWLEVSPLGKKVIGLLIELGPVCVEFSPKTVHLIKSYTLTFSQKVFLILFLRLIY